MITARDYRDFARAIRVKLEQEIRLAPISRLNTPGKTKLAGSVNSSRR